MAEITQSIPARLKNVAVGGHVAGVEDIYDDNKEKTQKQINAEVEQSLGSGGSVDTRIASAVNAEKQRAQEAEQSLDGKIATEKSRAEGVENSQAERISTLEAAVGSGGSVDSRINSAVTAETTRAQAAEAQRYTKSETYNKEEVNGLVDTPHQEYVTVEVYSDLPVPGSKDTIYRVSNYNGSTSQVDASVYSEYAWNDSQYIFLCVKSQVGEVFDISVYNNNAKYADLAAALNGGANIPQSLQKGGMSVKFVQSSDNKYVQYRLMSDKFSTTEAEWQGVDDEPTVESDNLVKSGGVYEFVPKSINLNRFIFEQGYINVGDGSEMDSANYVRTKIINIKDSVIACDSGFIIRGYAKYSSDGTFIDYEYVNGTSFTVSNSYIRAVIRKSADNTAITPNEVMLDDVLSGLMVDVEKNTYINLNRFHYSQGFINLGDGDEEQSDKFIRTTGFVNVTNHVVFSCDDDFIIRGYAVYNNGAFSSYVQVNGTTCGVNSGVYRFVVRKAADNTAITPSEFMLCNEDQVNVINLNSLLYTQGHINVADGSDMDSQIYIKTDFLNVDTSTVFYCDKSFLIRGYAEYDANNDFVDYTFVSGRSFEVPKGKYRITVQKATANTNITPSEFVLDEADEKSKLSVDNLVPLPISHFSYDTSLLDVTSELSGIDMNAKDSNGCWTFQDQIYSKFDALVSSYPDMVERINLGTLTEESYPAYANLNGQASGSYLATPTYRTYMYKIAYKTSSANAGKTSNKRKIFVVAGLHGWENASQLNTYIVASMICKAANEDWFSLASMYDFYFVPCLNGYGAYHDMRDNADGVDINRNFPAIGWTESGQGTEYYTGTSAASEFETKLIVKAINIIKPDIFIDHHSYGVTSYDFYVEPPTDVERDMAYTNLYAWNYRACKDYGSYYGTRFDNVHIQGFFRGNEQSAAVWASNLGIINSSTVEVCLGIAYENGVLVDPIEDAKVTYYQPPIVKLNELMLRLFLTRFGEYQLKNGKRTNKLDSRLIPTI